MCSVTFICVIPDWNAANINVVNYTHAFLALKCLPWNHIKCSLFISKLNQ